MKNKIIIKVLIILGFCILIDSIISFIPKSYATSYSSDYKYWSQCASDYPLMRSYGCWVVAQSKLIYETGIDRSESFNPDTYAVWEKDNGLIYNLTNNLEQTASGGGNAPVIYAQQKGKKLEYLGNLGTSAEKLWENIGNGYYTIIEVPNHYVYLDNELSKEKGELYVDDSYNNMVSAAPRPLSVYSKWKTTYVYEYKKDLVIDLQPYKVSTLTWDKVEGADSYRIRAEGNYIGWYSYSSGNGDQGGKYAGHGSLGPNWLLTNEEAQAPDGKCIFKKAFNPGDYNIYVEALDINENVIKTTDKVHIQFDDIEVIFKNEKFKEYLIQHKIIPNHFDNKVLYSDLPYYFYTDWGDNYTNQIDFDSTIISPEGVFERIEGVDIRASKVKAASFSGMKNLKNIKEFSISLVSYRGENEGIDDINELLSYFPYVENLGICGTYYPSTGYSGDFLENCKALDNFKNLKSLYITKAVNEEDLKDIVKHKDTLESLTIYTNNKNSSRDCALLANLTNLKSLTISEMPLKDALFVNKLKKLESMRLERISFENNDFTINNKSIKKLILENAMVPDNFFNEMTNLEYIEIGGIYGDGWSSSPPCNLNNFPQLSNLKCLMLGGINISDISFVSKLTNLEEFWCIPSKIEDVSPLKKLVKLKKLEIDSDRLRDLTPLINLAKNGKIERIGIAGSSLNPNSKKNQPLIDILENKKIDYYIEGAHVTNIISNLIECCTIEMENLGTLGMLISKKSTPIEELITSENFPALDRYDVNVVTHDGAGKKLGNVGSKDRIQIVNSIGDLIKEYTVVVPGDVTGNGLAKMYDAFQILNDSLRRTKIDELDTAIRDYDGDGNVRMYDAVQYMKESLLD